MEDELYVCYECGYTNTSRMAMRLHKRQSHHASDDPRRWAQGTLCQV